MHYLSHDTIEAWPGHMQLQNRHNGPPLLMPDAR
jgi:hypothetical protein